MKFDFKKEESIVKVGDIIVEKKGQSYLVVKTNEDVPRVSAINLCTNVLVSYTGNDVSRFIELFGKERIERVIPGHKIQLTELGDEDEDK